MVRSKSPGYHLLVQCLHETHFLRLVFEVIDSGCKVLDRYANTAELDQVEATTLNALLLLKRVLHLQVFHWPHGNRLAIFVSRNLWTVFEKRLT